MATYSCFFQNLVCMLFDYSPIVGGRPSLDKRRGEIKVVHMLNETPSYDVDWVVEV
jgi:hypothetical protein